MLALLLKHHHSIAKLTVSETIAIVREKEMCKPCSRVSAEQVCLPLRGLGWQKGGIARSKQSIMGYRKPALVRCLGSGSGVSAQERAERKSRGPVGESTTN